MLGIGEYARRVGLSVSAVRFYADRGLLVPAAVDPATGYRSFAVEQVETGRLIRDLRRIDLSLAAIDEALVLSPTELAELVDDHVASLERGVATARRVAASLGQAPQPAPTGTPPSTTVPGCDLADGLTQVLPFASTDPELPHLMTIRIEGRDGSVRLVASDTFRLAVRDLVPTTIGASFQALVPAASVQRWAITSDAAAIAVDDDRLTVVDGDTIHGARLVPATFPDYERHLTASDRPDGDTDTVVVSRPELIEAVAALDGSAPVTITTTAKGVAIESGNHIVEIGGRHGGDAHHTDRPAATQVARQAARHEIGQRGGAHATIDPLLVLDCIRGALGPDVAIEIERDPLRPLVFRSARDGTYTSLLMPIAPS